MILKTILLSMIDLAQPTAPPAGVNTEGLADFLRKFFAPLFLVVVSVVALFFLFTREITRFVQFIILAVAIGVIFYVPNIIEVTAKAIAGALGISGVDPAHSGQRTRGGEEERVDLPTYTNIWRIEKRLYKLYDLRLPMPLPIVWIGVFVGVVAPWSLLLYLLGLPSTHPGTWSTSCLPGSSPGSPPGR